MRRVASRCLPKLTHLRKRGEFLAAARARRTGVRGFLVQARKRQPGEADNAAIRVGFTCSKKVGNAVARNRARRRLRALAAEVMPDHARDGWDYVLIGRKDDTARRPFEKLKSDLVSALSRLHDDPS